MTTTKNPDGTLTIQLTAEQQTVMDEVDAVYSLTTFDQMIAQWLDTHREAFSDRKRRDFEQQFEDLASAKQQQVRNILEGKA